MDLTGNLYLPKGYDPAKDGVLPVLIWAYPREYKSAADAAQVRGSKYAFTRLSWGSPIFWATQGYAVLDNAEMPIVGEGDKEPNDQFIPQLYLNAHAAIKELAVMGVGDSTRVGVGGHSYGAFMTANLLAHTKLFKAGIARSGAYNRTLTPFGFQAEERTYWQAPQVYFNMSPFSFADKVKTPILLIHGELDNNSGTFPIQSERFYNALKGHGATVRYVQLPFESHGYAARENLLHMLWEQHQWLEKYVKNAGKYINPISVDPQVFLQDQCRRNLIDRRLVATVFLFHTHLNHGPGCHLRGVLLIDVLYRDPRESPPQTACIMTYTLRNICIRSVQILGQSDQDPFNWFLSDVRFQKIHQFMRLLSAQSRCNDLFGVRDRHAAAFQTVINGQDSGHIQGMRISAMTNMEKTTLAMPLAVMKARFTLDRSFGFTIDC